MVFCVYWKLKWLMENKFANEKAYQLWRNLWQKHLKLCIISNRLSNSACVCRIGMWIRHVNTSCDFFFSSAISSTKVQFVIHMLLHISLNHLLSITAATKTALSERLPGGFQRLNTSSRTLGLPAGTKISDVVGRFFFSICTVPLI